jgi:plastocyanin
MKRLVNLLLILLLISLLISSCDRSSQTVSLTTEDFKFIPDVVQVNASMPLSITIYNAGREIHEFESPVLSYSVTASRAQSRASLQPGETLHFTVAPPPGTYLYFCRRKGHTNMTGTMIVQ